MKCSICKTGCLEAGFTTVVLNKNDAILIFKDVPADICDNCGEYYLSEEISKNIYDKAEKALKNGAEVEIIRYVA
ncbi:MAG: type II toxin-antitoxin system MqsA family antitoxin [Candidatus Muiribacteriota bacterium]